MLTDYECQLLVTYLDNLAAKLDWRDREAERLIGWVLANEKELLRARGANALARWVHEHADLASIREERFASLDDAAARWTRLCDAIGHSRRAAGDMTLDVGSRRLNWLGKRLRLSRMDRKVLEALARYATHPVIGDLVDTVTRPLDWQRPLVLPERVLACLIGSTPQILRDRLALDSPLARFGLATTEGGWGIGVGAHVRHLMLVSNAGQRIRPSWLRKVPPSPSSWKDFQYLGQDREDTETILGSAIERGDHGVNILVHGPAETDKAAYCSVLAERVGTDLFSVSASGENSENGSRHVIRTLLLAQTIAGELGRAALLAGDLDDIVAEIPTTKRLSRLLGETPVPTFWVANDIGGIHPDVIRQMGFAVRLRSDPDLRARSWLNALAGRGIYTTLREARVMAQDYGAPPGVAMGAVAAAGDMGLVARSVQSLWPLLARRSHRELIPERLRSIEDLLPSCVEGLKAMGQGQSAPAGIATGFEDLDALTGGLQPGGLIVIAGRPSMGKSAMALNIAEHAAIEAHKTVAIFSLELTREQVQWRLLGSIGRLDQRRLRTGRLSEDDWPRIDSAASVLSDARIFISDSPGLTATHLTDQLRRMHVEQDIGLVIVDYLQLMRAGGDTEANRAVAMSEAALALKGMAKALHVPVIAVSQLNRRPERRSDKQPVLSDLGGSGAIEEHADVVVFIYRDEVYDPDSPLKGVADITVAKNRNGPTGAFLLNFSAETIRFDNFRVPEEEADA